MTTKSTTVQSLDRALFILEILSDYDELGLNELTEKSNLNKTTVYRLLNSLIVNGYVEKNEESKNYSISLKLFELGNKRVQNIDFLNVAKSMIRQLSTELHQIVHLVIEDNDEVLYIDKYGEYKKESIMQSKIGLKAPMYCTAVGKAILATKDTDEIIKYWNSTKIKTYTDKTIITLDEFLQEIEEIRRNKYAMDNEENEYGVVCIGASFSTYKKRGVGAISTSFLLKNNPDIKLYIPKVIETADTISKLLGASID